MKDFCLVRITEVSIEETIPKTFFEDIALLGIEFDDGDVEQLASYLHLLYEKNRVMNLTAVKSIHDAWERHIYDSLTLLPILSELDCEHVIDVGSGGGLPGIPLAITLPEMTFVLVETTQKKALFLSEVVEALSLENVTVLAERAEQLASDDGGFRSMADVVVSRAVGAMPTLLELTVPFLKIGGTFLAVKGQKAEEEVEQARKASGILGCTFDDMTRTKTGTIVSYRKTKKTPKAYPRPAGEPKRMPLGKGG